MNICDSVRAGTTVLSGAGSYKITAAGKYKIILRGGTGYYQITRHCDPPPRSTSTTYYGSGGVLTATKEFSKGVTLTIKTIGGSSYGASDSCSRANATSRSWSGGAGVAFWAGGSAPVLAAGGGGSEGYAGGGGFSGGGGSKSSGYNWTGATGSSGVSCNGKCTASGGDSGGAGYCESGYTCIASNAGNGQAGASASVIYCGPTSSSPCP